MLFTETKLTGAYIIDIQKLEDNRGFFARSWCQKEFEVHDLTSRLVQANVSLTERRGMIRGMHYQVAPYEEAKLIRCTKGAIYDVIIDLRPNSTTYMQWIGVELTADNYRMLFAPEGCAHGFQTMRDNTEVFYHASQFYQPSAERGVRWNDTIFGIEWPEVEYCILSTKDQNWPDFIPASAHSQPVSVS